MESVATITLLSPTFPFGHKCGVPYYLYSQFIDIIIHFLTSIIEFELSQNYYGYTKLVNEYDQEIPQSLTADKPVVS